MGLYLQLHSMHGLFRSYDLELGRDEDTGGQIVYVLELGKALGKLREIERVDIITRRIIDPDYPGYSNEIEEVTKKVSIVRIECGPKKYIKKVDLWPYLPEFIENCKKYIKKINRKPDVLQSNYADSGLVCSILKKDLKIPQVHVGHSLGIPKMRRLGVNKQNMKRYNKMFHFDKRLKAEKEVINTADKIIVSTREESKQQYKEYGVDENFHKFRIVPPGIDLSKFYPPKKEISETDKETFTILNNIIKQDLKVEERILVSVLSRLDKRKNLTALLKAFALDKEFQRLANLLLFAPTLKGDEETQKVINRINSIIQENNLIGHIALPGLHLEHNKQVPAYYRFLAKHRGIFVNPALIEPFGLTVVEASATGVPVVATKYGGPSEILEDGVTGLLIDPNDPKDIASKIRMLIKNPQLYNTISKNAIKMVNKNFTWDASARKFLNVFKEAIQNPDFNS